MSEVAVKYHKWGALREIARKFCVDVPCQPVATILDCNDVTVAYPVCKQCVHEEKFKMLKGFD